MAVLNNIKDAHDLLELCAELREPGAEVDFSDIQLQKIQVSGGDLIIELEQCIIKAQHEFSNRRHNV